MQVNFGNPEEHFIKTEVEHGFYIDKSELVREAVRRMRQEKERAEQLETALNKGIQSVERGETMLLTPFLLQEIKEEAIRKAQTGQPYSSSDALPAYA